MQSVGFCGVLVFWLSCYILASSWNFLLGASHYLPSPWVWCISVFWAGVILVDPFWVISSTATVAFVISVLKILKSVFLGQKLILKSEHIYWFKKNDIVDLQCSVSFCPVTRLHIHSFSHVILHYIPPQVIGYSSPVLYSRISLLLHSRWNLLHLLIPNSQSIPLPRLGNYNFVLRESFVWIYAQEWDCWIIW